MNIHSGVIALVISNRRRHGPQGVKEKEGVWRDYHTGEQLKNYTKPWRSSTGDNQVVDSDTCIGFDPTIAETRSWSEWECFAGFKRPVGCPCTYDSPPLIFLRGFSIDSLLDHRRFTVTQSSTEPSNIILVGPLSARIKFDLSLSQWLYSDPRFNVTAKAKSHMPLENTTGQ